MKDQQSTVCLAMLAHNEGGLFPAIWEPLKDRVDRVVVVVNPDDQATAKAAYETFDVPTTVYHVEWENHWANARNDLLDRAKKSGCDYILILDPDTPLVGTIPDSLTNPLYGVKCTDTGTEWMTTVLIRADTDYQYEGSVHEYLDSKELPILVLPDAQLVRTGTSGGEERMRLVVDILLEDLAANPTDTRAMFYLGQTYRDLHDFENGVKYYKMRVDAATGWDQEIYWSMLQIADMTHDLNDYLLAFNYRPNRVEALHRLAGLYNAAGLHQASLIFSRMAISVPLIADQLFLERWVIDYGILLEYSVALWHVGEKPEAYNQWETILKMDDVMPIIRDKVTANLAVKYANPVRHINIVRVDHA